MSRARHALLWGMGVFWSLLAACVGAQNGQPTPTATPLVQVAPSPTPTATATPLPVLRVWLPPELAADEVAGADVLRTQLEGFALAEGLTLDLRLKPVSGPGGMLPTLAAAALVAPDALPEALLLPRQALESAALKGLLLPLNELDASLTAANHASFFPFARDLGLVQDVPYGQALAGQALGLLYRPTDFPEGPPQHWEALLTGDLPLRWAAGDSQALLVLGLYQAAGGPLRDAEGRPTLDATVLASVLEAFYRMALRGQITSDLLEITDDAALWRAYGSGEGGVLLTDVTLPLRAPSPWRTALVPGPRGEAWSWAWGYLWAVPTLPSSRQPRAARLLRALAAPEFLGLIDVEPGLDRRCFQAIVDLPPHPDAVTAWDPNRWAERVRLFVATAQRLPTQDVLLTLGPPVQQALAQVLRGALDPQSAAAQAAAQVSGTTTPAAP